ncbi:hypothetical protein [Marinitoga aeolica]|uniref:Right handed beta helix domain-containing protein n=1 Tax=Marinitoga aeolica TaxID=2809031 RepID=A0ABY8PMX9_9BACT|nr:hypothetical protein [Marinitoga aeolica]WGS64004.1 hypothetical protein JRV97_06380 [Marinitoga aeolica]
MQKKYIILIAIVVLILIILVFKPVKVSISLIIPDEFRGLKYEIEIKGQNYRLKNNLRIKLFPGNYNIYVKLGNNKKRIDLKVPYFSFSKLNYEVYVEKPIIKASFERKDYDRIYVYLNSKNYNMDYWVIKFNDKEYKTTLSTYKLCISPYDDGKLTISAYLQGKKIYEKIFDIKAPLSKIIDYKMEIKDYIEITLDIGHKIIDPIKYEIYKNNILIDTTKEPKYRDNFTYDKVKYRIIPIYYSGYKGESIEIEKPKLSYIPDKINTRKINIDMHYEKIILNGKDYNESNFIEGENNLIIQISKNIFWYKKVFLDTTPPKINKISLYYNGIFYINIQSNEKSKYILITNNSTYTYNSDKFSLADHSKEATIFAVDELGNESKPIKLELNPFPKYKIEESKNDVTFEFENKFITDKCELRIIDEENNVISTINVKKLNRFTFSNFFPGKEYRFILYIDEKFNKEIYKKITKPELPIIKSIDNPETGTFEIELLKDYKYNYYSVQFDDYKEKGKFSGKDLRLEIPLKKLTREGTLILWREFKGLKTETIKFNLRDSVLFNKKIYSNLEGTLKDVNSPYIVSEDIKLNNVEINGKILVYIFPGKKVFIDKPIKYKTSNSKLIFKPIKDKFEGIVLSNNNLKNIEIYNAKIGIFAKNNFDLYNLVIKKCDIGIYGKNVRGVAYNILASDNKKAFEIVNSNVEIKNSLFFDNEIAFNISNSEAYLYNLSIADSNLDIDSYNSNLKIKTSDFLNSKQSIKSYKGNLYVGYSSFNNNLTTIKSVENNSLYILNTKFMNNVMSVDIFNSPFEINQSEFVNNKKAIKLFNSKNDKYFKIKNSQFENNNIDIYVDGSNDVYVENCDITKYYDGNTEPTWMDENGNILKRGKIILKEEKDESNNISRGVR